MRVLAYVKEIDQQRVVNDSHCMLYINSHDNLHFVIYVKENRPCKLNQERNN